MNSKNKISSKSLVNILTRKPVATTIRVLEINKFDIFPIEQLTSVRNTINRISKIERLKFSTKTDENTITVTRTA